jgi:drug/metabolite transporter (DMT)-like permease
MRIIEVRFVIKPQTLRLAAIITACILWGATFFFGKIALAELTVLQLTLGRFVVAAVVLLPLVVMTREWPRRRDWPTFVLAAFLGVPVTFILQYGGLAFTTSTDAALIVGGFPLVMALGAAWFQGERLGRMGWGAVFVSTLGVALMVGSPEGGWMGRCLVLVSLTTAVAWVLLTKRLLEHYSPVAATAWVLTLGAVMTLPVTLLWDGLPTRGLSTEVVGSVLALGVVCTAATFTLWNWGLQRVEASRAGVFVNLEPVVGAFLGVSLLGEPLASSSLIGGCLVVACAVMVCLPGASARALQRSHRDLESLGRGCGLMVGAGSRLSPKPD